MTQQHVDKARALCLRAHEGQVDKAGAPYYLHPFAVAAMCETNEQKIVALLHDVLEDQQEVILTDGLIRSLFSDRIADALHLLCHQKGVPYDAYISGIVPNDLARYVKIRDLQHNMDVSRLPRVGAKEIERLKKYQAALDRLMHPPFPCT